MLNAQPVAHNKHINAECHVVAMAERSNQDQGENKIGVQYYSTHWYVIIHDTGATRCCPLIGKYCNIKK